MLLLSRTLTHLSGQSTTTVKHHFSVKDRNQSMMSFGVSELCFDTKLWFSRKVVIVPPEGRRQSFRVKDTKEITGRKVPRYTDQVKRYTNFDRSSCYRKKSVSITTLVRPSIREHLAANTSWCQCLDLIRHCSNPVMPFRRKISANSSHVAKMSFSRKV